MKLNYFKKKFNKEKILVTGHTGFKGTYLISFLHLFGAKILGISHKEYKNFRDLKMKSKIKSKIFNLDQKKKLKDSLKKFKPKYVFHLAAQPIVYQGLKYPSTTWQSNLISTINLLEVLENIKSVKYLIIITTDKVYKNDNALVRKKENNELLGSDSYSMSKVAIEKYIYYKSKNKNNFKIITVRSGNVIGGGDWSEKRLIPDIIKSIKNKKFFKLRSLNSVRPWIHVLDCIHAYICLAGKMNSNSIKSGSAWNVATIAKKPFSNKKIIDKFQNNFQRFKILRLKKTFKEKLFLMLDPYKIKKSIGWQAIYNFDTSVNKTIEWYNSYLKDKKNLTNRDIKDYLNERI